MSRFLSFRKPTTKLNPSSVPRTCRPQIPCHFFPKRRNWNLLRNGPPPLNPPWVPHPGMSQPCFHTAAKLGKPGGPPNPGGLQSQGQTPWGALRVLTPKMSRVLAEELNPLAEIPCTTSGPTCLEPGPPTSKPPVNPGSTPREPTACRYVPPGK